MNPLTESRRTVAAALAGIGVTVHDQPPGNLVAPCVVLLPGGPWIAARGHVTLDIVAYANPAAGNDQALNRLEDTVYDIREALFAAGMAAGDTETPRLDNTAGVLSATTPITIRTTCH
jgi:hypothetical protein